MWQSICEYQKEGISVGSPDWMGATKCRANLGLELLHSNTVEWRPAAQKEKEFTQGRTKGDGRLLKIP